MKKPSNGFINVGRILSQKAYNGKEARTARVKNLCGNDKFGRQ